MTNSVAHQTLESMSDFGTPYSMIRSPQACGLRRLDVSHGSRDEARTDFESVAFRQSSAVSQRSCRNQGENEGHQKEKKEQTKVITLKMNSLGYKKETTDQAVIMNFRAPVAQMTETDNPSREVNAGITDPKRDRRRLTRSDNSLSNESDGDEYVPRSSRRISLPSPNAVPYQIKTRSAKKYGTFQRGGSDRESLLTTSTDSDEEESFVGSTDFVSSFELPLELELGSAEKLAPTGNTGNQHGRSSVLSHFTPLQDGVSQGTRPVHNESPLVTPQGTQPEGNVGEIYSNEKSFARLEDCDQRPQRPACPKRPLSPSNDSSAKQAKLLHRFASVQPDKNLPATRIENTAKSPQIVQQPLDSEKGSVSRSLKSSFSGPPQARPNASFSRVRPLKLPGKLYKPTTHASHTRQGPTSISSAPSTSMHSVDVIAERQHLSPSERQQLSVRSSSKVADRITPKSITSSDSKGSALPQLAKDQGHKCFSPDAPVARKQNKPESLVSTFPLAHGKTKLNKIPNPITSPQDQRNSSEASLASPKAAQKSRKPADFIFQEPSEPRSMAVAESAREERQAPTSRPASSQLQQNINPTPDPDLSWNLSESSNQNQHEQSLFRTQSQEASAQSTSRNITPIREVSATVSRVQLRFNIIKARTPRLTERHWEGGALSNRTARSLFEDISGLLSRVSIQRMQFKLSTSQSDSEYLIMNGDENTFQIMRDDFTDKIKDDVRRNRNLRFRIELEPDPGEGLTALDGDTFEDFELSI
ncbi:MAG: hypothetical protein Q9164_000656 [Protoblastenia rupestris]